jgi:hypothetical protein
MIHARDFRRERSPCPGDGAHRFASREPSTSLFRLSS